MVFSFLSFVDEEAVDEKDVECECFAAFWGLGDGASEGVGDWRSEVEVGGIIPRASSWSGGLEFS